VTAVPALELVQVSKVYPGPVPVRALDRVSLAVAVGELVAVSGPSGSGKSTLLHLIGTLDAPTAGTVRVTGVDVAAMTDRQLSGLRAARIGFVFQQFFLAEHQSALGNVADGLLYAGIGRAGRQRLAAGALDRVGLARRAAARPTQLSGGERQRVAIARALVVEPDLLVCDEVTSALDVSVQAVIVKELRRLQRERHLAMIFITHNLALVRSIAQSAVVLRDGAVVEAGPVEQILERPADPYTIRLIADVPKLAAPGPQREAGGAAAAGAAAP
jgi:putative ABC transport system ATP-binding protein